MARKSLLAREEKKRRLSAKYSEKRKELKEKGDYDALQLLPRNSASTRIHNRCLISGRPRGFYRKFGISRLVLREMALRGEIPGVKKSSW